MKKNSIYAILLCGCNFHITDQEAKEELAPNTGIKFGDVVIDDRNIHYAYTDQKKDLLVAFIHGSPGSWNAFIDFFKVDSLVNNFDLVSLDRPGFGSSGYGLAETSIEKQAYYMYTVLRTFPHKKIILVGHSLGGPVVARMAMDYINQYAGIVLVAPSIDPEMEKKEWYRPIISSPIGSLFTPTEFEVSNDEIVPLKKELEMMIPYWKQIKIPVILIHGTDDMLVPVENAAFAKRMVPDTLLSICLLNDVNHFIPWSNPEEINTAIHQIANGR